MSWDVLIKRRFEVVTAAVTVGLLFVLGAWSVMVMLKAFNPYLFHFNLLMDILPWVTPVAIVLALALPLYWRVAGWLQPPEGGLRRLVEHRFELVAGAAAYLLVYTMAVWAAMVLLRAWDGYDFHYNLAVDWLPAIIPPWLMWIVGSPLLWKALGALGGAYPVRRRELTSWTAVVVSGVLGGTLLTGGGLLLNQGVYAGTEGLSVVVQQSLVSFGILVFSVGAICWAIMLGCFWAGWRGAPAPAGELRPLDRFRLERPRIVAQAFVLMNVTFGVVGLMMTAVQYVDAQDFHFYMAKDIWGFGLPLFFGWLLFALAAHLIPSRLAAHNPARFGSGVGLASGPTGEAVPAVGWGYQGRDLAATQAGS
ncbi:MAG: hypothetical protein ACYDHB_10055 [Candidatus Dormibacteria bacterium]